MFTQNSASQWPDMVVWQGYHEFEGKEYDDAVHPRFLKRGY